MRPLQTLDRVDTPEGSLELRRRGGPDRPGKITFLITIGGRVLMTSDAHRSEDRLAVLACTPLRELPRPRVVIGGLGMGFTLRASLDVLPPRAKVMVVDLNPTVVAWCRGPLAPLTDDALADSRVEIQVANVAQVIRDAPRASLDAIILDLYEGPHEAVRGRQIDPLYGPEALARSAAALRPGGLFAVWSEEPDTAFERRLGTVGFATEKHRIGGGRTHVVYLARRTAGAFARPPQGLPRRRGDARDKVRRARR